MRLIPLLFSTLVCVTSAMAAVNSAAIKQLRTLNAVPAPAAAAIVRTRAAVLNMQDLITKTNSPTPDPTAQKNLEDAQKAAAAAAKDAAPVAGASVFVSADQRKHLMDLVTEFYQEVSLQAKHASAWEIAMVASAIVLGALSTFLSLSKWPKIAAIASALIVIATGIPKVFPIHNRAVYYRTLTNQSYSLMGTLQIPYQMTAAEYNDGAERLKVLDDYRGTKYPETADIDTTTQDLLKELDAVKTPAP